MLQGSTQSAFHVRKHACYLNGYLRYGIDVLVLRIWQSSIWRIGASRCTFCDTIAFIFLGIAHLLLLSLLIMALIPWRFSDARNIQRPFCVTKFSCFSVRLWAAFPNNVKEPPQCISLTLYFYKSSGLGHQTESKVWTRIRTSAWMAFANAPNDNISTIAICST